MSHHLRILAIVFLLGAGCCAAQGAIYIVRPDGSGDFPTIQAALNAASSGDTIELANGVFTGNGNRDLDYLGKSLTVRSQSGDPTGCVIDCGGTQVTPHYGFYFRHGEGPQAVLENVTVAHGWDASHASGLRMESCNPTITGCILRDNRGAQGGAVKCDRASPTITGTLFSGNTGEFGGGVAAWMGAAPVIRNCTFTGNSTWLDGGAIAGFYTSAPQVESCLFQGNHADYRGGAVLFSDSTRALLQDCTFTANTSRDGGAGLCCGYSIGRFVGCTFYADSAANGAELTCGCHGQAEVERCILAFGKNSSAMVCFLDGAPTLTCCDVYGNEGGDWVDCIADQAGVNGNFSADPLFCDAANGDLTLDTTSPCLPGNHPTGEFCRLIGAWPVGCPDGGAGDIPLFAGEALSAHPNPLCRTTRITLARGLFSGRLSLEIFDFAGRRVRALWSGPADPAVVCVQWDGRDDAGRELSSGAYVCVLRNGGRVLTTPLLVVR